MAARRGRRDHERPPTAASAILRCAAQPMKNKKEQARVAAKHRSSAIEPQTSTDAGSRPRDEPTDASLRAEFQRIRRSMPSDQAMAERLRQLDPAFGTVDRTTIWRWARSTSKLPRRASA